MFFVWIWRLEDGLAGYRRPPWPVVGPVWRLGQPLEPGLPSRQVGSLGTVVSHSCWRCVCLVCCRVSWLSVAWGPVVEDLGACCLVGARTVVAWHQ